MTTVLRASPRRFVSTPFVERIIVRALRYLQSGYSVHLRGPAGTGKTTLALHIADMLARPIMLVFGDDEFKTSDLIGNQSGYTRRQVVDNYIHSVVKVEDEMRHTWVDSRLTLACREGFTLVYDEFNRSRPEVNNVLLSALEEKLLVLPPSGNRSEYIRVHANFRGIFTSNPEEYCGVHSTQDALMDRLVTINVPEPDELTQQEILTQKTQISRGEAASIVRLVKAFRIKTKTEKSSGLRAGMMIAKVCQEHDIPVSPENADFRDMCSDVLLSRVGLSLPEATQYLWDLLNSPINIGLFALEARSLEAHSVDEPGYIQADLPDVLLPTLELVEPEFAAPELATPELAEIELIEPELAAPNLAESELIESELIESELAESNLTEFNLTESNLPESELIESELIESELTEIEWVEPAVVATAAAVATAAVSAQLTAAELAELELAEIEIELAETELEMIAENFTESVPPEGDLDEIRESLANLALLDAAPVAEPPVAETVGGGTEVAVTKTAAEIAALEPGVVAVPVSAEPPSIPGDPLFDVLDTLLGDAADAVDAADADDIVAPFQPRAAVTDRILVYLRQSTGAKLVEIEQALALERFEMVDALRLLITQQRVLQQDRLYIALGDRQPK